MSTTLKTKITRELKELPEDKARIVYDFLGYLKTKQNWETTWEILGNKKFMSEIKKGEKNISECRYDDWETVKKRLFVKDSGKRKKQFGSKR